MFAPLGTPRPRAPPHAQRTSTGVRGGGYTEPLSEELLMKGGFAEGGFNNEVVRAATPDASQF